MLMLWDVIRITMVEWRWNHELGIDAGIWLDILENNGVHRSC